jgi:hypothetical protein
MRGVIMTTFEKTYGSDPQLALRILEDLFKAPEQKREAAEFLAEYANQFLK